MPTQLTPHFTLEEFSHDAPVPENCIPIITSMCLEILEPFREQAGEALMITSGYRSPEANAEAHGQPNSEHIWTPDFCAVDFYPGNLLPPATCRALFDWARNNPVLPYHQLILEAGAKGSSIIHVSINILKPGIRSVLEGATHNAEPYRKWEYVAYKPVTPPLGVEESTA